MKRNHIGAIVILIAFFLLCRQAENLLASNEIEADSMRVIQVEGKVQLLGLEQIITVSSYGTGLEGGDEVLTGPDGKAHILLSMLSDIDEIFVAPSSRIRVSTRISDSLTSIYHIHILYGKIRVKTLLNRAKQIRFDTDLVEVTADEGEFILESRKFGTSVGTIEGLTKMIYKKNAQEYQIPPKSMIFVSPKKSVSPAEVFVNELFIGVELNDKEKMIESYY